MFEGLFTQVKERGKGIFEGLFGTEERPTALRLLPSEIQKTREAIGKKLEFLAPDEETPYGKVIKMGGGVDPLGAVGGLKIVGKAGVTKVISKIAPKAQKATQEAISVGKTYKIIKQEGIREVEGTPVKIVDGIDTFIHKGTGGWVVSEASTGRYLASSVSKEGAIAKADFEINNVGVDKFKQLIAEKQLPAEKGIIPKELEPLAQEARKYKSAEEFVQSFGGTKGRA